MVGVGSWLIVRRIESYGSVSIRSELFTGELTTGSIGALIAFFGMVVVVVSINLARYQANLKAVGRGSIWSRPGFVFVMLVSFVYLVLMLLAGIKYGAEPLGIGAVVGILILGILAAIIMGELEQNPVKKDTSSDKDDKGKVGNE